ncbi:hypothetical protein N7447_001493 [Penicillium robsamsonii]|uniref:uncharacterized protein n=1 Tax=Penicillium robsamsonii TaxID=1792511 RepID=UPI002547331B|nr:uncharacterized protein N7447_001493 [Penicillium robsamsonii]KAJ5835467.1 hypothetical protein N7447_001493 [Penicillium robsamsonii]
MQSVLDIFSSVLSRSCGRRTPPSEIPKMDTLAGLLVELFRRLFAIFNHRTNLARLLGKDKLPVLRRLERDLPEYFVCYICHILHKYDGSECFGLSGSVYDQDKCPLQCVKKWKRHDFDLELRDQAPSAFHVYRIFFFLHLQLAMRRFYYGEKFGISTESLSYTQVRAHPGPSSCPEITSFFSTDAQICPKTPGLCLRI